MKSVFVTTLGCKVNQFESASFLCAFRDYRLEKASSAETADILVINTCAVTAKAAAQSRRILRKMLRGNPYARVVVTGCYAQLAAGEIAQMAELQNRVLRIIGNADKHRLVEAALSEEPRIILVRDPRAENTPMVPLFQQGFPDRTRAQLRIQDGCDAFCSYCIVPHTRGRSRSLEKDDVLKQAEIYAQEGYREIVVTGIHVGNYGHDLGKGWDIVSLLNLLCRSFPSIRFRLSSIEPLEISEDLLLCLTDNNNFMPHLHIPLQSGADDILLRMNRRYTTEDFRTLFDRCKNAIDDVAVGLDILTGFPGETDSLFHQTCAFLENLDFTYLHVFPYSRRPGTPAADFDGQIPGDVKEERVTLLRELGERKRRRFWRRYIGSQREVLCENARDTSGKLKGFTDNYIPVKLDGPESLQNTVVTVELVAEDQDGLVGCRMQKGGN